MPNEFDVDLTNNDNLNQKPLDEKETRRRFLNAARTEGKEKELLLLFAKYDRLLRLAKDEKERADIGKYGCYEIYVLLGKGGSLYVNEQHVYTDSFIK